MPFTTALRQLNTPEAALNAFLDVEDQAFVSNIIVGCQRLVEHLSYSGFVLSHPLLGSDCRSFWVNVLQQVPLLASPTAQSPLMTSYQHARLSWTRMASDPFFLLESIEHPDYGHFACQLQPDNSNRLLMKQTLPKLSVFELIGIHAQEFTIDIEHLRQSVGTTKSYSLTTFFQQHQPEMDSIATLAQSTHPDLTFSAILSIPTEMVQFHIQLASLFNGQKHRFASLEHRQYYSLKPHFENARTPTRTRPDDYSRTFNRTTLYFKRTDDDSSPARSHHLPNPFLLAFNQSPNYTSDSLQHARPYCLQSVTLTRYFYQSWLSDLAANKALRPEHLDVLCYDPEPVNPDRVDPIFFIDLDPEGEPASYSSLSSSNHNAIQHVHDLLATMQEHFFLQAEMLDGDFSESRDKRRL